MVNTSPTGTQKTRFIGPHRLIIVIVSVLCLGLLGSALFTFFTLARLRTLYLSNQGQVIAAAIEAQARGPGRRNNPEFWQSLFEDNYETYARSAAFLALVDQNGSILAGKGNSPLGSLNRDTDRKDIYNFDQTLATPGNPRGDGSTMISGWRLRVGLYTSSADFIQRLAISQLAVSGLAIAALVALSIYLLRMLSRFLEMKAREGSEAQLKSLGIMAASLAHEIRNPLGAMKGLTQLAREDLPSDHKVQEGLETVVREAERLEALVANLLDFSRQKQVQISEFDLMDLLANAKTMLQPRLDAANINLQFPDTASPIKVHADPAGLTQVLLNVLINAIEASPPGGVVALQIVRDERNRSIVVQIDDAGKGLGEHNPDELFQPFVTTKPRGMGLGLAVSRRILDGLGGAIRLGNNPSGGARCSIQLPLRRQK
ncbi:MAG: sensor histidine kinase [Acidobacteria bacterium]|nr:sensor histidine kinase [Acidobacteriota bacterium]